MHQTRHARRFYVGGFPPVEGEGAERKRSKEAMERRLTDFFNEAFATVLGDAAADFGGPFFITNVFTNDQKNYCFLYRPDTPRPQSRSSPPLTALLSHIPAVRAFLCPATEQRAPRSPLAPVSSSPPPFGPSPTSLALTRPRSCADTER